MHLIMKNYLFSLENVQGFDTRNYPSFFSFKYKINLEISEFFGGFFW